MENGTDFHGSNETLLGVAVHGSHSNDKIESNSNTVAGQTRRNTDASRSFTHRRSRSENDSPAHSEITSSHHLVRASNAPHFEEDQFADLNFGPLFSFAACAILLLCIIYVVVYAAIFFGLNFEYKGDPLNWLYYVSVSFMYVIGLPTLTTFLRLKVSCCKFKSKDRKILRYFLPNMIELHWRFFSHNFMINPIIMVINLTVHTLVTLTSMYWKFFLALLIIHLYVVGFALGLQVATRIRDSVVNQVLWAFVEKKEALVTLTEKVKRVLKGPKGWWIDLVISIVYIGVIALILPALTGDALLYSTGQATFTTNEGIGVTVDLTEDFGKGGVYCWHGLELGNYHWTDKDGNRVTDPFTVSFSPQAYDPELLFNVVCQNGTGTQSTSYFRGILKCHGLFYESWVIKRVRVKNTATIPCSGESFDEDAFNVHFKFVPLKNPFVEVAFLLSVLVQTHIYFYVVVIKQIRLH